MKQKKIFEMDLKTNEKLFLLYLVSKGCHLKAKKIEVEEMADALTLNRATVWRVKKVLLDKGLIKVSRASANAVQEYQILNPSDAK